MLVICYRTDRFIFVFFAYCISFFKVKYVQESQGSFGDSKPQKLLSNILKIPKVSINNPF